MDHDVCQDFAGWHLNRSRLTCRSQGCDGATIVRQPCMSDSEWENAAMAFLEQHPTDKIQNDEPTVD